MLKSPLKTEPLQPPRLNPSEELFVPAPLAALWLDPIFHFKAVFAPSQNFA